MLVKRSLSLAGHRTSLALEPEFWSALEAAAKRRGWPLARLVGGLDRDRDTRPLASACRVFSLQEALTAAADREPATA